MGQFRGKKDAGGSQAGRQGKKSACCPELRPGSLLKLADADQHPGGCFFDFTHRVITPHKAFRKAFAESLRISARMPPESRQEGGSVG